MGLRELDAQAESTVDPLGAVVAARQHRLRAHLLPLSAAVAVVVVGMAFSLGWDPVVRNLSAWRTPGDMWNTMRVAHLIGWGGAATIYDHGTLIDTFPGLAVLLAPVAMVGSALHLVEPFRVWIPHPSEWLLVGPVEMALGSLVLLPLDALARRLGVAGRRRVALVVAEAVLVWPAVAMWGHPEDLVALGLAVYALIAATDGYGVRCAILFGFAIAFQPLAVMAVPLAIAYFPVRRWPGFVAVAAIPSLAILIVPLANSRTNTTFAIVDQPTFPTVDHPTPWLALAPSLRVPGSTTPHARLAPVAQVVAAGPARVIALVLVVLLAVWVARRRPSLPTLTWLGAVALGFRCLFDPVLCPYYAIPSLALALVAAAAIDWRRLGLTVGAATGETWFIYRHTGEWRYFVPVAGFLLASWVACVPGRVPSLAAPTSMSGARMDDQRVQMPPNEVPALQG